MRSFFEKPGIQVLELGEDAPAEPVSEAGQLDQRRAADRFHGGRQH